MIRKVCFLLCATMCFGAIFFHEIVGSPVILSPLMASDLPRDVIGMLSFAWHTDVVLMLATTVLFINAALSPHNKITGLIATGITVGIGINAYGMALLFDPIMWQTPAPVLWTVIPIVAVTGVLSNITGYEFQR